MKVLNNIIKVDLENKTLNPFTNEYDKDYQIFERSGIKKRKIKVWSQSKKRFYLKSISDDLSKIWIDDKTKLTRKKVKRTFKKAILSGKIYEVKQYESPVFYNFESRATGKRKTDNDKRENNINQSKIRLRRLINANINYDNFKQNVFLTLSYKDALAGSDLKECKVHFKKFIMRLKYYLAKNDMDNNLKYVYVTEIQHKRQEKYNHAVWHFHVIFFNLPFIKNDVLASLWGYGFIKINSIDNVDNVGSYVVKYMEKDSQEVQKNSDLYGRSKGNLLSPVELKDEDIINSIEENIQSNLVYTNTQLTDYYDNVQYRQYNLNRVNIKLVNDTNYKTINKTIFTHNFLSIEQKKHNSVINLINLLKLIEKNKIK